MLEALNQVLARARRAPFYAERLPSAVADLEEFFALPLTRKSELRAAYPFGLCAVPLREIATYHESSGTSGEPTSSYFTERDWDDVASRFLRSAVGLGPGDALLVKTPYSMVTTAHQAHRAARLAGAMVVPADNRSTNMPYSRVIKLLRDLPITVAWCLPTEVLLWAAAAREAGLLPARDFPTLRAFIVAGEPMSAAKRHRLSALWNARVFEDYGSTETGSLAGECAEGRLHLWSDRLYFEVLDKALRPARSGQLVVTPLYREAMPLVRYAIEDHVELGDKPCACGSPAPTVRVLGRGATLATLSRRTVFPSDLEEAVYELPIEHGVLFWRARVGSETVEIEIAPTPGQESAAVAELQRRFFEHHGIAPRVSAVPWQALISPDLLTEKLRFTKPRFVFAAEESWESALTY
jgi:phenylacetate-CoA ligase